MSLSNAKHLQHYILINKKILNDNHFLVHLTQRLFKVLLSLYVCCLLQASVNISIKFSQTTDPTGTKLGMDDTWVLQSINILHVYFRFIWNFNMAVFGLLCFLIGLDFKSLPLYNCMCNGIVSWQECSVYSPLKKKFNQKSKIAALARQSFKTGPYGKIKNIFSQILEIWLNPNGT